MHIYCRFLVVFCLFLGAVSDQNLDIFEKALFNLKHTLSKNCGKATAAAIRVRIIGGMESVKHMWPWQVAILNEDKVQVCGGTLIAPNWVLTAAHCLAVTELYVVADVHDLRDVKDSLPSKNHRRKSYFPDGMHNPKIIETLSYSMHPRYNFTTYDNDIALVKLKEEVNLPYICLPKSNQKLPYGQQCTITGWGKRDSEDKVSSPVLFEAKVPIVSQRKCIRTYYGHHVITNNMFCAGVRSGTLDACNGDSGGPLACPEYTSDLDCPCRKGIPKWTIRGITSWGDGCGKMDRYGVYTVVDKYVDWIYNFMLFRKYIK